MKSLDKMICLWVWAKKQKKLFVELNERQITIAKEVLEKYPSLIKSDWSYQADPFVIALAVDLATRPQTRLMPVKRLVVT